MRRGRGRRRSRALYVVAAALAVTLASAAPASAAIVQRMAWGGEGSGAGQFAYPEGIEMGPNGHVYVADTINNRIQRFSAAGEFILAWGWGVKDGQAVLQTCRSSCRMGIVGAGNGQLDSPNDVASDAQGNVYVADTGNDRIQKFSPRGLLLDGWGSSGSGPGEFDTPVDIAVGPAGHVYVADFSNHRIQRLSRSGGFLDQQAASYPYGLAIDSAGNVYVAEYYDDRVVKFSPEWRFLRTWGWGVRNGSNRFQICGPPRVSCRPGIQGPGKGQFRSPGGIATDGRGQVYVADSANNRIQKFTSGGHFVTTWGEFGLQLPHDLAVSAGRVYVVDGGSDRVVKYAQIPPRTTITAAKVKDARGRAKFRFRSSEPGSSFRCKLDRRRFRRCDSPKAYLHLSRGRHRFKVRATNPDKLTDRTPARKRFWINR